MHSRSNSSAEATIKRAQGPKVYILWIYSRRIPKDKVKITVFQGRQSFRPASRKAPISYGCLEGHNASARSRAGNRNSSVHCQGRGVARDRTRAVAYHHVKRRPVIRTRRRRR